MRIQRRRPHRQAVNDPTPRRNGKILALLCIVVALVIGTIWYASKSSLAERSRYILALVDNGQNQVALLILYPQEQRLVWVSLPSTLKIPLTHGYGEYQLGVISRLGAQEGYRDGLLSQSLGLTLGLPVEATVHLEHLDQGWAGFSPRQLILQSNAFIQDKLWLGWRLATLSPEKMIDVSTEYALDTKVRADGITEYLLTPTVKRKLADDLGDIDLQKQQIEVAVINATDHAGLATKVGEAFELAGFDVISIDDSTENRETSQLLIESSLEENDNVIAQAQTLLGIKARTYPDLERQYRSQMAIILGEDFWKLIATNTK